MHRRQLIATLVGAGIALPLPTWATATQPQVEVWKDAGCGCCKDWIIHLEANGFAVKAHDGGNKNARKRWGMPSQLGSCHTARVAGYTLEGHVPAADVKRILRDKPKAIGLSVPGMPIGSPGMDGPQYGHRHDAYDVLLVNFDGSSRIFQSYAAKS